MEKGFNKGKEEKKIINWMELIFFLGAADVAAAQRFPWFVYESIQLYAAQWRKAVIRLLRLFKVQIGLFSFFPNLKR